MKCLLLSVLTLVISGHSNAQSIEARNLQKHVEVLAADSLEGRGSGTKGERMAATYIATRFQEAGLLPVGVDSTYYQPFGFPVAPGSQRGEQTALNVVGYLDNGAPKTIVIGAHYDHLGRGYQPGSRELAARGNIHNGADDNASGTAGVIELAYYLVNNKVREKHNFLFVAFSGEELGLLGSKYIVDNSPVPLDQITSMFNMDMIGRLDPRRGVTIGGWGTSPAWGQLIPALAKQQNLKYRVDSSGVGASDHTSFYLKGIPVLFLFTGVHNDYHKTSDDTHKINFAGSAALVQLLADLIEEMEATGTEPSFTPAGNPHAGTTQSTFKVTLGVMPDYAYSGIGLRIDAVTENRPAAAAGMKAGDIVIRMGEYSIRDIQDYMKALGKFEKDQTTEVEVQRGKDKKVVKVTF